MRGLERHQVAQGRTVGFEKLAEATATPSKSLIRMFGLRSNAQARNLFGIIGYRQKQAGIACCGGAAMNVGVGIPHDSETDGIAIHRTEPVTPGHHSCF